MYQLNREVSYIGRAIFETNDKRLRLGVSGIRLNTSYDPSISHNDSWVPALHHSEDFPLNITRNAGR